MPPNTKDRFSGRVATVAGWGHHAPHRVVERDGKIAYEHDYADKPGFGTSLPNEVWKVDVKVHPQKSKICQNIIRLLITSQID